MSCSWLCLPFSYQSQHWVRTAHRAVLPQALTGFTTKELNSSPSGVQSQSSRQQILGDFKIARFWAQKSKSSPQHQPAMPSFSSPLPTTPLRTRQGGGRWEATPRLKSQQASFLPSALLPEHKRKQTSSYVPGTRHRLPSHPDPGGCGFHITDTAPWFVLSHYNQVELSSPGQTIPYTADKRQKHPTTQNLPQVPIQWQVYYSSALLP